MGSAASHPSPSPTSCIMSQPKSTTRLFTVPGYSQWPRMPAGSSLVFAPFFVRNLGYRLRVYPARFDEESRDFVAVFLERTSDSTDDDDSAERARISIEIPAWTGEAWHIVFDNHTARSEQTTLANHAKGYVRFVKRRELEAASCVHDDSFHVLCTVTVKAEVTYSPSEVLEALSALSAAASSLPKPPELSGTLTLAIGSFSRIKAGLRTGECVHSAQFYLDGSRWFFKVYPNGRRDATSDCMSVFLCRGRFLEPATTAEFGFEIVGLTELGKVEFTKQTFHRDVPEHGFPSLVMSSDLASFQDVIRNDRVVVRCHLRVINVTMPSLLPPAMVLPAIETSPPSDASQHHLKVPSTSPLTVEEETENEQKSESVLAPLLNDIY